MPKETKKFINPLLRPSQEAVVKENIPARTEEKVVVPPELPPASVSTQEKRPTTAFSPTPVPADVSPPAQADTELASQSKRLKSVQNSTLYIKERIEPEEEQSERVNISAPVVATASANDAAITSPAEPVLPDEASSQSSLPYTSSSKATTAPETRKRSRSHSGSRTSTYTGAGGDNVNADLSAEQGEGDDRSSRRKKDGQTFESTHERITLWVDKKLKQGFEALAYQSELPKTALMNEAVSDLLKKYNIQ